MILQGGSSKSLFEWQDVVASVVKVVSLSILIRLSLVIKWTNHTHS